LEIENKNVITKLEQTFIKADKADIENLIDNNLKNAIKYSTSKDIFVTLKNNTLIFQNEGVIKNKDKVFDKFYREENIKGGFGLGLSIIKSIAKRNDILVTLNTKNNQVIFKYKFKDKNENSDN